jgi:heptosyltransferase-3
MVHDVPHEFGHDGGDVEAVPARRPKASFSSRLPGRSFRRRLLLPFLRRVLRRVGNNLVGAGQLDGAFIHRILVLRPNHRLGNILLLTPLLAELESTFPGAEIDVLIAGNCGAELLDSFARVRRVYALPQRIIRHPVAAASMVARLRSSRYDLAVDASASSYSSRLVLALASPRYRIGVPARDDAAWSRLMLAAPRHFAKLPVFLVRQALACNVGAGATTYPALTVRLAPLERETGRKIFEGLIGTKVSARDSPTLGVFANATGTKCYSESWWLEMLGAIATGLPDCKVIEFVPMDGHSRLGHRFPTYYSSSIRKLASVISHVTCFISGDCGVMHLASASGVPTIGLFSVSDPARYEPYGEFNRSVLTPHKNPGEIAAIAIRNLRRAGPPRRSRACADVRRRKA